MPDYKQQLVQYLSVLTGVATAHGETLGESCGLSAQPLVLWIHWYRTRDTKKSAVELLTGAEASIREAAGCVAIGLGRAALTAIRTQVDLLLGYTFFREHPVEWRRVCDTGEGFKLKAELLKYHSEYTPGFSERRGILDQVVTPNLNEVYRTISAHVHGQSRYSVPSATELKDLVWNNNRLSEIAKLQGKAARSLSFFLLAVHGHEWRDLPSKLITDAQTVLTPAQQLVFFT